MLSQLTVLVWRKGSGVDVDVRVDFDRSNIDAAAIEQRSERARNDSFADAADHAARHQNVLHRVEIVAGYPNQAAAHLVSPTMNAVAISLHALRSA